jgi:16S rRNA (guanine1207-N2)-methyltransferase
MLHIHKSIEFLTQREFPDQHIPDLVYRPSLDVDWSPKTFLVDYDLSRLRRFNSSAIRCAELEDLDGDAEFHRMLIYVTQFDSLVQVPRDLYAASRILSPLGELRVLVRPKGRPKKVDGFLKKVFSSIRRASGSGNSLLICTKPVPKKSSIQDGEITYFDKHTSTLLRFATRSGMFSCSRVDPGTEFLLTFLPELKGCSVLDVGCGYGIIGLVAAVRGASVTMVDADARAIKLSRHNLALNQLAAKTVLDDQIRDSDNSFDLILSNPPTHAGSLVLQRLFTDMLRVCRATGRVLIVVREHLNYEKWLQTMGVVTRVGACDGYKVLQVYKTMS